MPVQSHSQHSGNSLPIDWSTQSIIERREKFYAASQRAFVPYEEPLIVKRGQGQYIWDENDKKYLDLLGMNLCISVGHCHPAVVHAVREQAELLMHCTTMFYHPVPAHFAEELVATMPASEDWVVHFTNSGAEAVDLALTMARSFTGNTDFLALAHGYHGATIGAQSLTGIAGFRHNMPLLAGIHHVANPDQYRGIYGPGTEPYLDAIDHTISTATSGRLAGIMIEPVQGYGGIIPMPPGYISGAAERVRAGGGLLVVDEVQSGFGRTGEHYWAFEADGVVPDIVVMAKGIGDGVPLGAVVAKRDVASALDGKFYFNTYGANPMACAAGRAVLRVIEEEGLQQNAAVIGGRMLALLNDLKQRYEIIGDVRGRGLMMAIELVTDRSTKAPATAETVGVYETLRHQGVICSKSGAHKNVLRMVPPLCVNEADVAFFSEAMETSFRQSFAA